MKLRYTLIYRYENYRYLLKIPNRQF